MGKRILPISIELFAEMFHPGERHYEVIGDSLPEDTIVLGCRLSFDAARVELCLSSAEWDEPLEDLIARADVLQLVVPVLRQLGSPEAQCKTSKDKNRQPS